MKRVKTIFCVFLAMLCTLAAFAAFAGCKGDSDKRYFVEICVKNTQGGEFIFSRGTDEIERTYSYTGEDVRYYIYGFRLPDYAPMNKDWVGITGTGDNIISISVLYTPPGGKQKSYEGTTISEKGHYLMKIRADSGSDYWNLRTCRLIIDIV